MKEQSVQARPSEEALARADILIDEGIRRGDFVDIGNDENGHRRFRIAKK